MIRNGGGEHLLNPGCEVSELEHVVEAMLVRLAVLLLLHDHIVKHEVAMVETQPVALYQCQAYLQDVLTHKLHVIVGQFFLQVQLELTYRFIDTSATFSEFCHLQHLVAMQWNSVKNVDYVIVTCNFDPLIQRFIVLLLPFQKLENHILAQSIAFSHKREL